MRIEDLNWMDVESYLQQEDRLILILGACEQHGYLSLLTDAKIPMALADAASQQTGVLVAPVQYFGVSPHFLAYPGTLSLRVSTLLDLAEDLIHSAYGQGFRRFLILNGHGGNDVVRGRLAEVNNALPGMQIAWYAWWQAPSVQKLANKYDLQPQHASWMEAFPFTRVTDLPEDEKVSPTVSRLLNAEETRRVYGDGVYGGFYKVDDNIMEELFRGCLEEVLALLRFEPV